MMKRSDFRHYPLNVVIQDALILLTPVFLMLIGVLVLE
jgi:hypothetical protein